MPNYQNGKIYKIASIHMPNECYIGSTVQTLLCRISKHRCDYKLCVKDSKKYRTASFEIMKYTDATISLICEFPCASKTELEREEGLQMIKYGIENIINKNIAGRTKKEWLEENKEKIKLFQKNYREENKERLKEYREENKERFKERQKEYREENKESIKEKSKEHNNKEHVKESRHAYYMDNYYINFAPTTCPFCSSVITKDNMKRHQKSKKCLKAQAI